MRHKLHTTHAHTGLLPHTHQETHGRL